jgi:hypothetical protein
VFQVRPVDKPSYLELVMRWLGIGSFRFLGGMLVPHELGCIPIAPPASRLGIEGQERMDPLHMGRTS